MEDLHDYQQVRHRPPAPLDRPRELIVACAPLRSNVNLSRILRAAGCAGIPRVICCGHPKVLDKIARDAQAAVQVEVHRTLLHPLKKLKDEGYQLVGLEQTTGAHCLYDFRFVRRTALVLGNERLGITAEVLAILDHTVEIPVYGLPHAHNVATATAIALYEYCRQYPRG